MSDVKRWTIPEIMMTAHGGNAAWLRASDHDRLVAELRTKYESAVDTYCESVDKGVKRVDELIVARETIATQKRVIEKLKELALRESSKSDWKVEAEIEAIERDEPAKEKPK